MDEHMLLHTRSTRNGNNLPLSFYIPNTSACRSVLICAFVGVTKSLKIY